MKYSVKVPTFEAAGPFSDEPVDDVKLADAPLVRVLAQLRFTGGLGVLRGDNPVGMFAPAFADAGYPLIEEGHQVNIELTPEGVKPMQGGRLWTLRSPDRKWQVSLTPEFVTLDTGAYIDRDDFVQRLGDVIDALKSAVSIPGVGRIGYRYVNRAVGLTKAEIRKMVRDTLHGGIAVPEGNAQLHASVTETTFSLDLDPSNSGVKDGLLARWGHLQPGFVLEPSVPPVNEPSWTLDIDAFRHRDVEFDRENLIPHVREMSERAYRFFRWSVTDAFLTRYGAAK